ncbi:MAG: hypothetical protein AUJ92_11980 [Armatimonadetes bacterium CG2_30_59_28]|nr:hypothetical protein [Armatimonadota bacterium]OIO93613.1 MAG: hypothetical protein AUJ92_11980 [Armatimonadetes bacterium CG2_30_59_28]PIU66266.1 MAG: hypothetical protein COS85_05305 [Armatimonadetes bacterium CG07_land_8_20_14_0_80_59_28]PIX40479.1 MAG: hypothetical protein COZ56_14595 [Armatimonadetes bacterium CG_4_8_14_3_um_filter_58_9]PIY41766.1 MAG: hypothetical protein COZ05_15160 [Armatimonadetes bacterium CG_4_10_14_3_um_filter_59_10]PJB71332.1 MAG: hypothetical protein CO095_081
MSTLTAAQRRVFISMASRRQKPGTGSSLDFLRTRTATFRWPDLSSALAPIPWATIGAVATRHYMPERMTHDLDIVIAVEDGRAAQEKLARAGYRLRGPLSIGGSTWTTPDGGTSIDVVEGRDDWWPAAIREAQENRDQQGLPILSLPYLVLMKFQSGRVQDFADITRMLGQADAPMLARVREVFAQRTPDERADLESMITLGKMEIQP